MPASWKSTCSPWSPTTARSLPTASGSADRRGALPGPASRGLASADRGERRRPGKGIAGGRHRSAGGAWGSRSRLGCRSDPLFLVPSQRRRHARQARPCGAEPLRGGHGGDGLRSRRSTGCFGSHRHPMKASQHDQAQADGVGHRLRPGGDLQLGEHRGHMGLDGMLRYTEPRGNNLVAQSFGE